MNWDKMWRMESRLSDFSSFSVMFTVDKFIKSVEAMNETVMVPSRLLNVEPPENGAKVPLLLRGNSDPYTFYAILNNVKHNLLWGMTENDAVDTDKVPLDNSSWFVPCLNGKVSSRESTTSSTKDTSKGHFRRISSVSTASVASSSGEPECERMSDAGDSGVESEETESPTEITSILKTHLSGLHDCLRQLTETATYITERYQEEVSA